MNKLLGIIFFVFIKFLRFKADDLPTFEVLWAPDVVIVGESHEILLKLG